MSASGPSGPLVSVIDLLLACQKGLDKQYIPRSDCFFRSTLIRVFPVCYSDKHFLNSHPDNQHNLKTERERCSKFLDINSTALISVTDLQIVIVACQKGLDKQCIPRSDCFFYSLFAILTSIF